MLTTMFVFLISSIKEKLRQDFAKQANDFQAKVNALSNELVSLDGDLDVSWRCGSCIERG